VAPRARGSRRDRAVHASVMALGRREYGRRESGRRGGRDANDARAEDAVDARPRRRERSRARWTRARGGRARVMYEPSVAWTSLQYSCDACGELPILRRRWTCERCEDFDLCEACHARQHKRSRERAGRARAGTSDSDSDSDSDSESESENDTGHDATHELRSYAVEETMEPLARGSLRDCVLNATARWYVETLRLAKSGDANAAALCAQMLLVGYGCNADSDEAVYWNQIAKSGGARKVQGVYDELP